MSDLIDLLTRKHLVWSGRDSLPVLDPSSSGYASLDEKLDGGLPKTGVVGLSSALGLGELRLLLPTLLSKKNLNVFINPPGQLSAEFLYHQEGFDLNRVLVLYTHKKMMLSGVRNNA